MPRNDTSVSRQLPLGLTAATTAQSMSTPQANHHNNRDKFQSYKSIVA